MRSLDAELAVLATMSPAQLRERWQQVHCEPPPAFGPDLLARSLAYKLQEKTYGGLPAAVAREIRQAVADLSTGKPREPGVRPGTRLTREWHGRTHHVQVTEGGYDYRDKRYRSLTAIAREITGAGWSGPRFFGLKSSKGANRAAG